MKTIKISIIFALAALLFASCANDASDSNTADSNAQNNSQSAVEYTLSFDVNVPEDTDEYYWSVGIRYTDEISGSNFNPNTNAATSVPEPVSCTTDTEITLPVLARNYTKVTSSTHSIVDYNQFNEDAYTYWFVGWNTKKDASGTSYSAGDKITLAQNLTLYAVYMKKDGTLPVSSSDDSGATNILDMYTTTSFSMKVGETVTLKPSWTYGDDCYYTITSNDDDAITLSGKVITAENIGTAVIKMTANASSSAAGWCTISVTAEGFEGKVLENKLLGTWKYTGSSSSGTIVLNSDMTGHITAYLNGSTVHDNDFTWSAYEGKSGSTTYQFLKLKGTGVSSLDCDHQITNLSSARFTMKGYLAFGMPSETTWKKQ